MKRLALSLGLILGASTAVADVIAMTEAELQTEFVTRKFRYNGEVEGDTKKGSIMYREDGTVMLETKKGLSEAGTWWFKGDQVCSKIEQLTGGEETCYHVGPKKNGKYKTSNGFTLTPQ